MGHNSSSQEPDSPAKRTEILLKEYDHRFSEITAYSERYHKQTDILNVAITISIAVGAYLSRDKSQEPSSCLVPFIPAQPTSYSSLLVGWFLTIGAILLFYLLSLIMNSLFLVYVNGARIAAIEEKLNKLSRQKLLIWDSEAIPHFFGLRFHSSCSLWIRPTAIVGSWLFVILIFASLGLCVLAWKFTARWFFWVYSITIAILFIFHLVSWLTLHLVGRKELREYFSRD